MEITIVLSGYVTTRAFERALRDSFSSKKLPNRIVLDLQNVSYLGLHTTMLIVALISRLQSTEREIKILIPTDEFVCDFLAAWEFFEALAEVTSRPYNELLDDGNLKRLRKAQDPIRNRYMYAREDESGVMSRLYSSKFFSIQTFRNQFRLFSPSLAIDITRQWREAMVKRVLDYMLPEFQDFFRSRIVFEAIMNAIRHPNAEIIQTASSIRKKGGDAKFCVCFWDNGRTIPSTLRQSIRKGISIKGSGFGAVNCLYRIVSGPLGRSRFNVGPEDLDVLKTSESGLLLASTFPGVTCDPFGITQRADTPSPPGMGLYFLTNAAVTVFGGRVEIRSGRSVIELRRSGRPSPDHVETFHARQRSLSMAEWIPGNLLWVEIPIPNMERSRTEKIRGEISK